MPHECQIGVLWNHSFITKRMLWNNLLITLCSALQHLQFTFMWDIGQKFDLYGKILNIWLKITIVLPALILGSVIIISRVKSHLHTISWIYENSSDYTLFTLQNKRIPTLIKLWSFHQELHLETLFGFFLLFKNVFWQESDQIWVPMLFYIGSCWKEVYFCLANMYSSSVCVCKFEDTWSHQDHTLGLALSSLGSSRHVHCSTWVRWFWDRVPRLHLPSTCNEVHASGWDNAPLSLLIFSACFLPFVCNNRNKADNSPMFQNKMFKN